MSAEATPGGRRSSDKPPLSRKRRSRRYRETPDTAGCASRLILTVGKRVATEDPKDLAHLLDLDAGMREAWSLAVAGIRASGFSDTEIGAVLGVSKQAVQQRWPR